MAYLLLYEAVDLQNWVPLSRENAVLPFAKKRSPNRWRNYKLYWA